MDYRLTASTTPQDNLEISELEEPTVELTAEAQAASHIKWLGAAPTPAGAQVMLAQVSVEGEATSNGELRFTLHYKNQSPHNATLLVLQCALPAEVNYVPGTTVMNGKMIADNGDQSMLAQGLPLDLLAGDAEGEVSLDCVVAPGLRDGSFLQLTAQLMRQGQPLSTHTCYVVTRGHADFSTPHACRLSAAPMGPVKPGDLITYTFSLSNQGTGTATSVQLSAIPPEVAIYVPNSTRWEGLPLADAQGRSPLFSTKGLYVGTLLPGQGQTASFQMRVQRPLDAGTMLVCRGRVLSQETAAVEVPSVTHQVSSKPTFTDSALNFLRILKDGQPATMVNPGDTIACTAHLANHGDSHAYDARLWMTLPRHVQYLPGSLQIGSDVVPDDVVASGHLFSEQGLALGKLEAPADGAKTKPVLVQFQGKVDWPLRNGTEINLEGSIAARYAERTGLAGATATVEARPEFKDVEGGLTVTPSGKVKPGDVLTYQILWKNSGNAAATEAVLRAGLPFEATVLPNTTYRGGELLADVDGTSVLFSLQGLELGAVEAGEDGEVSFQARVASPLTNGTVIQSKAALTCAELPPVVFSPVKVEVESSPSFSGDGNRVETSQETAAPGAILQYVVHLRNNGDANATGVVLRAHMPEHCEATGEVITTIIDDSGERPMPDVGGTAPIFSPQGIALGTLTTGQALRVNYGVRLKRPLPNEARISHSVWVACAELQPLEVAGTTVTVYSTPDFSSPDNAVEMQPGGDITPGQTVTCIFRYHNSGGADASDLVLRIAPSQHLTVLRETLQLNGAGLADVDAGELFSANGSALGTIAVDQAGTVRFDAQVATPLDSGTILDCVVTLAGLGEVPLTYKAESKVKSRPDFSLAGVNYMSAKPPLEVSAGGKLVYFLHFENTGNAKAYRLAARVQLSERVTYVPGTTFLNGKPVADVEGTSPLLNAGGLFIGPEGADSAGEISLEVKVAAPVESGTQLTAQGFLEVGKRRGLLKAEEPLRFTTAKLVHNVISFADFSNPQTNTLSVSPAEEIKPGERLYYTLRYHNNGNGADPEVRIGAGVPENTVFVGDSMRLNGEPIAEEQVAAFFTPQGLSLGRVEAGAAGSISYQVYVKRPLDNGVVITNQGFIKGSSVDHVTELQAETSVTSKVDFSAEGGNRLRPHVEEAAPGDAVQFTAHFINRGDSNATEVVMRLTLPEGDLTYVPDLTTVNGIPVPEPIDGGTLLDSGIILGDVAAGASGEVTFTVRVANHVPDGSSIGVGFEIWCEQGGGDLIEAPQLPISAPYDFSDATYNRLEVYPDGEVSGGQILTYTFTFTNRGTGPAPDVVLRAQLPEQGMYLPGTTFLNGEMATDESGVSPLFTSNGLEVGTVGPGAYGDVVYQVKVKPGLPNGTLLIGKATLTADGGRTKVTTNAVSNPIRSMVNFGEPDGLFLEVQPAGFVEPKDTLTYTVHYHNNGNSAATEVLLSGQLPPGATYLVRSTRLNGLPVADSDDLSPLFTDRGLAIPRVEPGESGRVTVRVQVDSPLPSGTPLQFQVKLQCQEAPAVHSNEVVNTVVSFPRFIAGDGSFLKSYPSKVAPPGQVLTFVLYFQNRGSTDAQELRINALMPPHTSYVQRSTRVDGVAVDDVNNLSAAFGPYGLVVPNVVAGASGTVSFQLKIADDAPDDSTVDLALDLTTLPATSPTHFEGSVTVKCRREASKAGAELPTPGMAAAAGEKRPGLFRRKTDGVEEGAATAEDAAAQPPEVFAAPVAPSGQVPVTPQPMSRPEAATQPMSRPDSAPQPMSRPEPAPPESPSRPESAPQPMSRPEPAPPDSPSAPEPAPPLPSSDAVSRPEPAAPLTPSGSPLLPPNLGPGFGGPAALPGLGTPGAFSSPTPPAPPALPGVPGLGAPNLPSGPYVLSSAAPVDGGVPGLGMPGIDTPLPPGAPSLAGVPGIDTPLPPGAPSLAGVPGIDTPLPAGATPLAGPSAPAGASASPATPEPTAIPAPVPSFPMSTEATSTPHPAPAAPLSGAADDDAMQLEGVPGADDTLDQFEGPAGEPLEGAPMQLQGAPGAKSGPPSFPPMAPAPPPTATPPSFPTMATPPAPPTPGLAEPMIPSLVAASASNASPVAPSGPVSTSAAAGGPNAPTTPAAASAPSATPPASSSAPPATSSPASSPAGAAAAPATPPAAAPAPPPAAAATTPPAAAPATPPAAAPASPPAAAPLAVPSPAGAAAVPPPPAAPAAPPPPVKPPLSVTPNGGGAATDLGKPASAGDGRTSSPIPAAPVPTPGAAAPADASPEQLEAAKAAQVYFNRGTEYAKLGQYQNAIDDYNEAIRLNPTNPFAYYNRGMTFLKLGQFQQAIDDYSSGLRIRPGDANAYNNLGNAYNKLGKHDSAIEVYSEALKLNPKQAQVYLNRGLTYVLLGLHELAAKDFTEVVKLNPQLAAKIPPGHWKT